MQRKIFWLNLLIVVCVAVNLRAPVTSIGPIVDAIQEFFGINAAQTGLLGSIVLAAFGLVSFLAVYMHPIKGMFIGILCIIIGEILRSYLGLVHQNLMLVGLFGGTMVMGSGIAIANVLLPSFIRGRFGNKIPKIMGLYSLMIGVSAVLGIVLILPLLEKTSLPHAMGFWIIFGVIALLVYYPQMQNRRFSRGVLYHSNIFSLFKNLDAWKITLFMGLQSLISYSIFAWYPKMIIAKGFDREFGANMILIMQSLAIPVALSAPFLITRLRDQNKNNLMILLSGCYIFGFSIFLFFENPYAILLTSLFCGVPSGGFFSLALFFISSKARSIQDSAKLSAMTQGFGYLIASFGPYIIGRLYDFSNGFFMGLVFLIFMSFVLGVIGVLSLRIQRNSV